MKLELDIAYRAGNLDLAVQTSLELDRITGLFGPSGAGKTTLLRIIAGLEREAIGDIRFNGHAWQTRTGTFVPAHQRRIGYVFQDGRLFSHLDVNGNLLYGYRRRAGNIGYDEVVTALDLAPLLYRHPETLSGGEQQRVAIGRALLSQPGLLLMDEPVSALDLSRRGDILQYLQKLPELFAVPFIYVTHSIEEIACLATKVLVLKQGRLVRHAGAAELFGDTGVTGHTVSVIEATVTAQDHHYRHSVLIVADQPLLIPGIGYMPGTTVRLHIHARDVSIALQRPEQISIRNILSATISELEDAPDSTWVDVCLDLGGNLLRSRVTRYAAAELGLHKGQQVFALIKGVSLDWQA